MSLRRRVQLWVYLIPLTLATAFYLPGIFFPYFFADGGLYAAVSLRMVRTGEWWTPMQANATYFNKPPLAFWIRALCVKALGESDWVLRLPELFSALACVVLITSIVKRLHGPRAGLVAGILLALTSEYIWRISRLRLDLMHTALMLAGLRFVVQGATERRHAPHQGADTTPRALPPGSLWIILSGLPIGLALLVKPMFGLLMLVIAACWLALAGRSMRRKLVWIPAAALLALAVAAPWHISMWLLHGHAFTDRMFVHESVARATGEAFGAEPWWWYFQYFLRANEVASRGLISPFAVFYWPILACVVLAVIWWLRGRSLSRRTRFKGGLLAQFYAFGFFALLCAFGDKKAWYLFSVLPAFAWVAALWITTVAPRPALQWAVRLIAPAGFLVLAAILIFGKHFERPMRPPPSTAAIQRFIRDHPDADVWNISMSRYNSAPIYIRTGVWPKLVQDPNTGREWEPPRGSYLLYEMDDKKAENILPDPADPVIIDTGRFQMVQRQGDQPIPRAIPQ